MKQRYIELYIYNRTTVSFAAITFYVFRIESLRWSYVVDR
jgi:hypothetical protein